MVAAMRAQIRSATPGDRTALEPFLTRWDSLRVARRGVLEYPLDRPALLVEDDTGRLVAVLTYVIRGAECEILTLHSDLQWSGIGSALLAEVRRIAHAAGCTRLWLITTNDNVDALRFYQRRGFRIREVRPGAVDRERETIKPEIPATGKDGIPISDEIELVIEL
jgi:ribosomal protein S18 acetylase RimI-like enzyme